MMIMEIDKKTLLKKKMSISEEQIKIAIQNLINEEEVSLEYLEILETALSEPQITYKDWKSYFDAEDADQAISNPNMVLLLTLQAIILPDTLTNFLVWLQKRSKEKEHYEISLYFQEQIINKIGEKAPKIDNNVTDGIKLLLPQLLDQPELLQPTIWLLGSTESIWGKLYNQEVKKQIDNDLSLMMEFSKGKKDVDFHLVPEWEAIWNQLRPFWSLAEVEPKREYLPLAKLFNHLTDYKFSAVFYQISQGSVPKSVFREVTDSPFNFSLYQLNLEKAISQLELLGLTLNKGGGIVPVYFVVPAFILLFILGGLIGELLKPVHVISGFLHKDSIKTEKDQEEAQKVTRGILAGQICGPISEITLDQSGDTNYQLAAQIIKTSINKNDAKLDYSVLNLKPNELKVDSLDEICSNPEKADLEKIEIWRKVIFIYQLKNNLPANGKIDDQTQDKLTKLVQSEVVKIKRNRIISISFDILKNLVKKDDKDGPKKKAQLVEILNNALSQSKDKDNKSIQLEVNDLDGSPNQKTKENWSKAIKAYQQQNRLLADGLVGNKGETINKLKAQLNLLSPSPKKANTK